MLDYAVSEADGRRVLVAIVCDECGARLKPGAHVPESGWMRYGRDDGPGTPKTEWDYCESCSAKGAA